MRVFRFFAVLGCGDDSFLGLEACGGLGGLVPGVLGGFSICGVDGCGWFLVVLLAFGCGGLGWVWLVVLAAFRIWLSLLVFCGLV